MEKLITTDKIIVAPSKILIIGEQFGCKGCNVYNSLSYRSNSAKAKAIRKYALERCGGKKVRTSKFVNTD
jgi:hypothetical protein